MLREQISAWASKYEKFGLIDKVVQLNGLKVTFLLRLAPIIPFNAFNYFMGLTSVTLRDYCIAHFGMLPGTAAYCFLGTTLSSVSDAGAAGFTDNIVVLVVFIVCLVLAFVGMGYIGWYAKKEFNKLADQVRAQEAKQKDIENAENAATAANDDDVIAATVTDVDTAYTSDRDGDRKESDANKSDIQLDVRSDETRNLKDVSPDNGSNENGNEDENENENEDET